MKTELLRIPVNGGVALRMLVALTLSAAATANANPNDVTFSKDVAPIFQQWMEPFKNFGMTTLTIRNTGGTDHLSYDAVGLPGFQFIQDSVEYNSRTHHSNMDVYERIQANDMMRNAVIVASFVLNTANRDEKLPRKPLPKPAPAGRGTVQP